MMGKPLKRWSTMVPARDGLRLNVTMVGLDRSAPFVVVPGTGGFEEDFAPLARARTLACLHVRNRGHSELTDDADRVGLQLEVDDIETIRHWLGARRIQLVGHSYLGAVVGRYLIDHPEAVDRAVLISTLGPRGLVFGRSADETLVARARARLARLMPPGDEPLPPTELPDRSQRSLAYVLNDLRDHDWREECARAGGVPVLVIAGEEDWTSPDGPVEWARALPNARLLRWSDCSHFPWRERPDEFFPAMEVFLSGNWPTGSVTVS